ncbi:unnamed protein product [Callosobruchus maculatus]|uniref:Uncharacterized protein n=1 Tax=Callosobruchus maculatus TaxID=64391 RepID=A0A653BYR0_CALMS|nr:unnamed protein product [Callosobruchus maculatus]VEN40372.1 unnamed protein product [Callosobruchus maculatus]
MSGYRNYATPWNKPSTNLYSSGSVKKDATAGIPKFDTSYTRSRPDPKKDDERSATSRIASKYTSPYSAGYQRDTTTGYGGRTESSRIKPILDKKDTSHPPVSYRPINRTGARSRDSSPIEKSDKSSSSTSSSYNYGNRLYPRPFQRSVSKERVDSTIPKYTGRSASSTRDEVPKYGSTLSVKEDVPKYLSRSPSRNASREDLTSGSQKYINSRFLPKNTVEKSYTAYSRPLSVRTNETSRKNRELLNVLHAQQEQERLSRPTSRCSSTTPDEVSSKEKEVSSCTATKSESPPREVEMETVKVVTRGTSPTPVTQNTQHPTFLRSRRIEIAKVVEKQISRPKRPVHTMVDKEIQSDRLDDSTKISRYAGASRMSATPWSSFLDMKFSSPAQKSKTNAKVKECDSPKSLSRTSSSKSLEQSPAKSDKPKEVRKSPSPAKSKIVPPKQISDKKQLPPIPKGDNSGKSGLISPNKDFRKSVLNMNPEGKSKKIGRRSNSASSAESDNADPEATDVSENLKSCGSYHNSNSSKVPQKSAADRCHGRSRRSPSAETSNTTSGSEDDSKTRKIKGKLSAGSSRTSVVLSSGDELSTDKSPKPPQSPRNKYDVNKSEADAKSFLMRALAPVTNLFKVKPPDSPERSNWMDPSTESNTESKSFAAEPITARIIIHRVESTEAPWSQSEDSKQAQDQSGSETKLWWETSKSGPQGENSLRHADSIEKPFWENSSEEPTVNEPKKLIKIKHADSGETPWWLDESAEVPEGVETYPNYVREDGTTADGRVIYKIRKNDSGETSWWQTSSDKTESSKNKSEPNNSVYPETQSSWVRDYKPKKLDSEDSTWWLSGSEKTESDKNMTNIMDPEYQKMHQIRHIDSGEREWWLSQENKAEEQQEPDRQQDSGEKPWWLQKEAENEFDNVTMPLGDRASPEGLEMPKDDEGRKSPYDNVPGTQRRTQKSSGYISRYMNIDEVLGGAATQIWSPLMDKICGYAEEPVYEVDPDQVVIHEGDRAYQKMTRV